MHVHVANLVDRLFGAGFAVGPKIISRSAAFPMFGLDVAFVLTITMQRECFSLHSCSRAKKKRLPLNGIISLSLFWYSQIPFRNLAKEKATKISPDCSFVILIISSLFNQCNGQNVAICRKSGTFCRKNGTKRRKMSQA